MRAREFIPEGADRKPLRKSVTQSMPNLTSSGFLDNNNHPYLAYRFGVALAASPDPDNMHTEGPIGSDFTMVDFSEGDTEIRKVAAKRMGVNFDRGTGKGSEEVNTVNTVSPVNKPKKNRFGV